GKDRLCALHLICKTSWGSVVPSDRQCLANRGLLCCVQPDIGGTSTTPRALDRRERPRLRSHEELLLLWRELDHAPAAAGIAQRREDPAGHTKVRVAHVSGFGRAWQAQSEASELAGCHARYSLPFLGGSSPQAASLASRCLTDRTLSCGYNGCARKEIRTPAQTNSRRSRTIQSGRGPPGVGPVPRRSIQTVGSPARAAPQIQGRHARGVKMGHR